MMNTKRHVRGFNEGQQPDEENGAISNASLTLNRAHVSPYDNNRIHQSLKVIKDQVYSYAFFFLVYFSVHFV